jgi:hypothetical protein
LATRFDSSALREILLWLSKWFLLVVLEQLSGLSSIFTEPHLSQVSDRADALFEGQSFNIISINRRGVIVVGC